MRRAIGQGGRTSRGSDGSRDQRPRGHALSRVFVCPDNRGHEAQGLLTRQFRRPCSLRLRWHAGRGVPTKAPRVAASCLRASTWRRNRGVLGIAGAALVVRRSMSGLARSSIGGLRGVAQPFRVRCAVHAGLAPLRSFGHAPAPPSNMASNAGGGDGWRDAYCGGTVGQVSGPDSAGDMRAMTEVCTGAFLGKV